VYDRDVSRAALASDTVHQFQCMVVRSSTRDGSCDAPICRYGTACCVHVGSCISRYRYTYTLYSLQYIPPAPLPPCLSSRLHHLLKLLRQSRSSGGHLSRHQPHRTLCHVRVRVEIMGSQKCRIVGESQSLLIMINSIIFTRTRTQMACVCRRERLCFRRV
jgi:hypothetical protein